MYTIATALPKAIAQAHVAPVATCAAHVTAAASLQAAPMIPVAIAVLAIGFLMLALRISYALLGWATHLAEFAAAIGRRLIMIALAAGLIAIILLHL
jgi:hypothetical protein